ncbi:MAG: hypothetical protein ACOYKP_09805, partial [Polynucleobacter sp.]
DDDTAACISEINSTTTHGPGGKKVQMKVKFHDKMRAIEMLSKHLSLLASGEDTKSIPLTPDNIAELCRAAREQKPD